MPFLGPSPLPEDRIDEITNRLLEVLRQEFSFTTTPLGVQQRKLAGLNFGIDDEYKESLRKWSPMRRGPTSATAFRVRQAGLQRDLRSVFFVFSRRQPWASTQVTSRGCPGMPQPMTKSASIAARPTRSWAGGGIWPSRVRTRRSRQSRQTKMSRRSSPHVCPRWGQRPIQQQACRLSGSSPGLVDDCQPAT